MWIDYILWIMPLMVVVQFIVCLFEKNPTS